MTTTTKGSAALSVLRDIIGDATPFLDAVFARLSSLGKKDPSHSHLTIDSVVRSTVVCTFMDSPKLLMRANFVK